MRVPTVVAAVSVATSAVLLLSACGGSDQKSSDKIAGVPTGSPSASASPTTTVADGRPLIMFPKDAKDVFEGQQTGDSNKDAVLADNAQWVESMDDAIFQGTANTKALGFYSRGKGLESATAFVKGALSKGYTWTGEVRFFNRTATILKDGSASVIYCSDESKEFLKHRKTGKIDNTPTTADSYVLYNTHLKKNQQGVWQTDNVGSVRGAKQCQP